MSSLAPTQPPETGDDGGTASSPPAPPPESDDIAPPPAPILPFLPPLLSSPPAASGGGPVAAPPLPAVVIGGAPPPTSPIPSSPPPPLPPQPLPQPPPQPPQPQPQPPTNSPPQIITNPPPTTPTNPPTAAAPPPQQPPRDPPRPIPRQPNPEPSPDQQSPSRPKTPTPSSSKANSPPLPTSAVLPSPPPVALPVPQAPDGGAWMPFSPEAPAPLPVFPGPPVGISPPAAPLFGKPANEIPANFGPSDSAADHQNIETSSDQRSNGGSSGILVGLCVAGVLLLLLGIVFAVLVIFCRKKQKKFDGYGAGSKNTASFTGFEGKSTVSQYTKPQDSNTPRQQVMINVVPTSQGSSNLSTSTPFSASEGPTPAYGALRSGTFTYEELAGATEGFSDRNLLGQGGFGYVYKGVLPNGKEVAVKQLKMGGHQGEREFRAEVDTISQVHHKHLVTLVGYCIAGAERLLVYEFVPNNTLEFHLHGKGQPVMDWPTRLKIAIGSAKGLAYLHEDCSPAIIHRDIKAANILLDYNCEAKVSDFGLAKIFTNNGTSVTHMTTRVVGTFGYLAPEYASSGKVTDKSDVYSYGVMLLELITGRPPISNFESGTNGSLVNWARPLLTQAIGDGNFESLADPRLQKNYDVDEMGSMVACAAACVRLSAWRRPRMSQVVHALEGNLPLSELDDGTRPGHSAMHFPYESLDFDARNYMENMKRMAMTSNVNGYMTTSMYSDNTSEYGLNPSGSSTDTSSRHDQRP